MEKPKLCDPLTQSEAVCVEKVQRFQTFDTLKYGDICWPELTTAFA